jgi:SagB-type dehydrogenase family enzyme
MNHDIALNFYSDARLSSVALDFLEHIKFQPYNLQTYDKFELINFVNNDIQLLKKIFSSNFEVGFCETIDLVKSTNNTELYDNFLKINQLRKSIRKYSETPITFSELSDFLNLFYSITGNEEINFNGETLNRKIRNIGSGGSLYPTEIYVINNRIEEIKKGAYHYNVVNNQLELITEFDEEIKKNFFKLIMHDENRKSTIDFDNTSVFIVFTSVINKLSSKYQDFGVALSLIEVGQFVHSAYLSAATLDLACCPFGGILNDNMRDFLEINNSLHYPVMCMSIGKKNY